MARISDGRLETGRTMPGRRWGSVIVGLLLLLSAVILCLHSLAFNFVTDDAFISFVYARNLLEHGALVFNLDERVEGYTNFLWTLLLTAGMAVRVAPEIASRVLGTLCAVLTLAVVAGAARRLRGPAAPPSAWDALPALILAGIPGYACWSSGGLETQLFTLLCTLGATDYLRARELSAEPDPTPGRLKGLGRSGLWLGLAALTRPEGYLFFGLLALHRLFDKLRQDGPLLKRLTPTRDELRAAGLFLLFTVPHVLWRRSYYGYFVPNTFYIKSSGGPLAFQQGLYYLFAFCRDLKLFVLPVLWLLGLVRPVAAPVQRRYLGLGAVTYLFTAVFLLYVVSVGGDFMGLYRFVMPIVPLNVLCGALGLWRLAAAPEPVEARPETRPDAQPAPGSPRRLGPLVLTGLLVLLHAVNAYFVDRHALTFIGADRGIDTPGYLRYYTNDRAAIGKWLGRNVQPDDYQVVGGAGAQVYYAGIRALDSFGLSDAYVAHNVPPVSTRPGHQKFAPLDYVLSRHPTILTYNVYRIADAPYQPSPAEAAMWRGHGFHYVSVQIPGLSKPWYSFLKRIDRSLGPLPKAADLD